MLGIGHSDYQNSHNPSRVFSVLPDRARILYANLLHGSEHIEITASDPRTGKVLDQTCPRQLQELKPLVRRNREALFTLHVWAGPATAWRVCAALGAQAFYDATNSGDYLHISDP